MKFCQKKTNMKNLKYYSRGYNSRNNRYVQKENDSIEEKANKTIYIQKMLRKENLDNPKNALNLSVQNAQKVFNNVENLFTNESTKKNAIKYVIQIGKNKPKKPIINRDIYQLINYQQKKFRTIDNDNINPEVKENNPKEMDIDLSLSNEEYLNDNQNMNYTDRIKMNNIIDSNNKNCLSKSLQKRKQKLNDNKNKRPLYHDETEELIKIIDELKEANKNLRKDSKKKNKKKRKKN